jgi:hypothetical protein
VGKLERWRLDERGQFHSQVCGLEGTGLAYSCPPQLDPMGIVFASIRRLVSLMLNQTLPHLTRVPIRFAGVGYPLPSIGARLRSDL